MVQASWKGGRNCAWGTATIVEVPGTVLALKSHALCMKHTHSACTL